MEVGDPTQYGELTSALYSILALAPLSVITLMRICSKLDVLTEFVYLVLFLTTKFYCIWLLHVQREVCHIRETQLSPEDHHRWRSLRQRALSDPPTSAAVAVEDQCGFVRWLKKGGQDILLTPVVSLISTQSPVVVHTQTISRASAYLRLFIRGWSQPRLGNCLLYCRVCAS